MYLPDDEAHDDPAHDDLNEALADLPAVETLVACALSLMTIWAAPCAASPLDRDAQRRLLARKITSNLYFLQHHPGLSPALRRVMANAHPRWVALAAPSAGPRAAQVDEATTLTAAQWH